MEHIELINRIIAAEQRAKQIAEEAERKREGLREELRTGEVSLRSKYFDRAAARLAKVKEQEAERAEEEIARLDENYRGDLAAIEAAYEKNKDVWVEKLFGMIVRQAG